MSVKQPSNDEEIPSPTRSAWEVPAFTELKISAETRSQRDNSTTADQPPLPVAAPAAKLGFSFEWAFPLTTRTEK
jgi:hypothetical protein